MLGLGVSRPCNGITGDALLGLSKITEHVMSRKNNRFNVRLLMF
jgi:hypothetical protein